LVGGNWLDYLYGRVCFGCLEDQREDSGLVQNVKVVRGGYGKAHTCSIAGHEQLLGIGEARSWVVPRRSQASSLFVCPAQGINLQPHFFNCLFIAAVVSFLNFNFSIYGGSWDTLW